MDSTLIGIGVGVMVVGAWFIEAALSASGPLGLLLQGWLLCMFGLMILREMLGLVL